MSDRTAHETNSPPGRGRPAAPVHRLTFSLGVVIFQAALVIVAVVLAVSEGDLTARYVANSVVVLGMGLTLHVMALIRDPRSRRLGPWCAGLVVTLALGTALQLLNIVNSSERFPQVLSGVMLACALLAPIGLVIETRRRRRSAAPDARVRAQRQPTEI